DPCVGGVDRGLVADVHGDADDLLAGIRGDLGGQLRGELLDGGAVEVGRGDAPSLRDELAHDAPTDAARGSRAGDQRGAGGGEGLDGPGLDGHRVLLRTGGEREAGRPQALCSARAEVSTWRM